MPGVMRIDAGAVAAPELCLVADIGGTNARFSLARIEAGTPLALERAQNFRVRDFATLGEALSRYLQELPVDLRPQRAVLAVASAVTEDRVHFTNSHWSFSITGLQAELALRDLHVVNDFAAVAWAVSALGRDDVEAVGSSPLDAGRGGMRAVVGPGTGLGVAGVGFTGGDWVVFESEGGHTSFAPRDDDEMFVLRFLLQRYERVSYERLLCGEGLVNLYDAWCARHEAPSFFRQPEDVSRESRLGNTIARAATRSFCSIFGSFAGDVALMYGAWQGVYLAGGLLTHVLDAEGATIFRSSFEDKGRFAPLLRSIPTLRITREDVGNFGAAVYGARSISRPSPRAG
jgi:glucokinase